MGDMLIVMQNILAMHVGIPSSNIVFGTNKDLGDFYIAIPVNVTMSTGHVTTFISDISSQDFILDFEHVPFISALRDSGLPFTSQVTNGDTIVTHAIISDAPTTPEPVETTPTPYVPPVTTPAPYVPPAAPQATPIPAEWIQLGC
jgi:hypothetical protein